ncbi:MAG: glycosyltransferase family 4 protein [Chloroflexi bacterium]|nr:glycosyltransferase family 4 protein [Chloroflexota bacterium]
MMTQIRAAFVMEQTLGHVTHFRNLRDAAAEYTDLLPTWLPIPFEVRGPACLLPLLGSNWSARASWRARRALGLALASTPHDALVFHTQVTALFSLDLVRRLPAIVSLDATPINYDRVGQPYGHRPAGEGWLDRQKYRLNRQVFQAAAGLVTWSEWARRSLVDDYGVEAARVRVLAPGAAPAYFELGERRPGRAAPAVGDERPLRLLFVGGDFHRKGGPLLLECLRAGLAERCELHLVTHEAVAPQRNVYLYRGLGPNSPELLRLFAQADVFVLPSLAECLAIVLMEATAAGLPVVTTDVGALGEAVRPGESGLLVPAGNAGALRQALEALVGDAQLRQRMGRAGHALARHKFDAQANNHALLDLVAEAALAGRGSRRAA